MADNVTLNSMSGGSVVASDEVTDATLGTAQVQYVKLMDGTINGTAKAAIDSTYGLAVDIKRTVNVVLGTGANVIGAVTQSGTWNVTASGTVAATQSGTWNIGSITTLPALATGSNVIGAVTQSGTWNVGSITTLPAIPTGTNTIGFVAQGFGKSASSTPWEVMLTSGSTLAQGSAAPTTTATSIVGTSITRRSITITNTGTVQVNIGGSGVTATTGIPLVSGASVTLDGAARAAVYGITASGTGSVAYLTESD